MYEGLKKREEQEEEEQCECVQRRGKDTIEI
jgi:hypothetical protein